MSGARGVSTSARSMPALTGVGVPSTSMSLSVLVTTWGRRWLPATQVTPRTSSAGDRSASNSASASS
ncbi:MAG: hypothetical protein R2851_16935 [Caldilineaceae bacterium]